ncbi:Reverse transcriptase domain-containing protein, partial [Aphis craccivora]
INNIKLDNGFTLDNTFDISNEFNRFFINVGQNIENNIISNKSTYINLNYNSKKSTVKDSIFLTPINKLEIKNNSIKPHSSYFEYGLNNNILKKTSNTIFFPLMLIFNLALSSSVYPDLFKKCVVTPIFKNGNKLDCCNYRPISLSLSLSKLLEKCLKSRLMIFLDKNKFLDKNQYGFINGRSTSNAHFQVNHYIRDN